jgi:hypothetical protein
MKKSQAARYVGEKAGYPLSPPTKRGKEEARQAARYGDTKTAFYFILF